MKTPGIAIAAALFLPALVTGVALAQSSSAVTQMTAREFETSILRAADLADPAKPPEFCRGVIDRLRSDKQVTNRTVMRCVEAFAVTAERGGRGQARYAEAERFVDDVLPLVAGNAELAAGLSARKATMAIAVADFAKAAAAYEAALQIVEPASLRMDIQKQQTLVGLGQSLLSQRKNKEAEVYFLQALSYPWYSVLHHQEELQQLRDQYLSAGRGLIQCRRGNLNALREIVFVPATERELKPLLEKAMQEAGAAPPKP